MADLPHVGYIVSWTLIESRAYWLLFAAAFLGTACWESSRPKRQLSTQVGRRWGNHAILLLTCSIVSMGLYRATPVFMATAVANSRYGLLNKAWLPLAARWILALLLLDLVKYAVHSACHRVPLLWRVHQVHHSDPDFDVSTGLRVHPIESILMQGAYLAAIAIFAPPVGAVLLAELTSIFLSFFGHANASLPEWIEKPALAIFVTPDMHRIHHSEEVRDQTGNLGDIFSWWDRLFGTYVSDPAGGQEGMVIGLKGFQTDKSLGMGFMLSQPFRRQPPETASSDTGA
jgi:sterol desaturase/sphingolipid hydroxylase (fatty acid hydroxylase superfamily)